MFISQKELCLRLNITKPIHNRMRRAGILPNTHPGVALYWWPHTVLAIDRLRASADGTAGLADIGTGEAIALPRTLTDGPQP